jgi:hypothetical protein
METDATPVDAEFGEIVSDIEVPPISRRSIKYRIVPSKTQLMMDFVFADNPDEADSKARAFLGIPEDEPIKIYRVNETSGHTGSLIKGVGNKK